MVGETERPSCAKEGRIVGKEIRFSPPPYESSNEEEVIKADESAMGAEEEGWR